MVNGDNVGHYLLNGTPKRSSWRSCLEEVSFIGVHGREALFYKRKQRLVIDCEAPRGHNSGSVYPSSHLRNPSGRRHEGYDSILQKTAR